MGGFGGWGEEGELGWLSRIAERRGEGAFGYSLPCLVGRTCWLSSQAESSERGEGARAVARLRVSLHLPLFFFWYF